MWSLVFGLATAVFFVLALSMPGPFNPLLFCTALALAAVLGRAVFYDYGRWRQDRDRKGSMPRRDGG